LDKLLVDNINEILPNGKYPEDVNDFLKWDDLTVLERIRARQNDSPIAKQFLERKVMSCVYETAAHSNSRNEHDLYNIIFKTLRDKFNCDIMKDKAKKMPHKIPMLEEFDSDSGKGIPILVDYLEKPKSIVEESILLKNLIIPININRLYIDSIHSDQAKKIVKGLLSEGDEE